MLNSQLFQAQKGKLRIYNGKPIIDVGLAYYYFDDSCVNPDEETEFDFPGYISSYLKIYNERLGRLIKTIPLDRNSNVLIINSNDTAFDDNGDYAYEVGYIQTGGYEFVLDYGIFEVV